MPRLILAAYLALATFCIAQDTSAVSENPAVANPDLALISLQPIARDDLNIYFAYTVRNNTSKPISPKAITIERVFTRRSQFDPAEKTNQVAGKTSFGGAKPFPPGGELSWKGHARLVDPSGRKRADEGYRFLHVRVIHQAPHLKTAGQLADVAVIDLEKLPADLPKSPPRGGSTSARGNSIPHWAWSPIAVLMLGGAVGLAKLIGGACWFWLPEGLAVLAAIFVAGLSGAGIGLAFVWYSPFGQNFGFFGPPVAIFYGLAAAIQSGVTASGSRQSLTVGSSDDD